MTSLRSHVATARRQFVAAGIDADEAALDARLLAEVVLGWDTARFLTEQAGDAPADFLSRYEPLVARRVAREPVAYIVGRQEFWGLVFEVTPTVLIPRPETELVVETAVARLAGRATGALAIADVGTGSGCLAVALAREFLDARLMATDISAAALAVARRNARRHGVDARIRFVETDLLAGVDRPFDLIVSNPPYVCERDRDTLQLEVGAFEPAMALFAGPDGMDVIERLVVDAAARLVPEGLLLFEFGFGQAELVAALLSRAPGLTAIDLLNDLQGIPRVAVAARDR